LRLHVRRSPGVCCRLSRKAIFASHVSILTVEPMPISETEILDRVRKVTAEVLRRDIATITPASKFREELGADSLDTVTLLMALEEEFKRPISDDEAKQLTHVQAAADFIKAQMPSGS
jgi:acyl carrier protein